VEQRPPPSAVALYMHYALSRLSQGHRVPHAPIEKLEGALSWGYRERCTSLLLVLRHPCFALTGSVGFCGPPRATRATHDTGTVRTVRIVVNHLLSYSFLLLARPRSHHMTLLVE
jgi:hypothetical protein